MAILVLVRGLPGAGKSSFGAFLGGPVLAADDYFYARGNGHYAFNPSLLPQAHQDCQERTRAALAVADGRPVVVANTFSCRWELEPYLRLAADGTHEVRVVDLFDGGLTDEALANRGLHGVPVAGIAAMRARWEHAWRDGDPRPPWERR